MAKHNEIRMMEIERTPSGYQLTGDFEQFRAAMELELSECLFRVSNNATLKRKQNGTEGTEVNPVSK